MRSGRTSKWTLAILLGVAALTVAVISVFCALFSERCGLDAPVSDSKPIVGGIYPDARDIDLTVLAGLQADPTLSERLRNLLLAAHANAWAETIGGLPAEQRIEQLDQAVAEADVITDPEVRAMALTGVALACLIPEDTDCAFAIAQHRLTPATAGEVPPAMTTEYETVDVAFDGLDADFDDLPDAVGARLDELTQRFFAGTGEGKFTIWGYSEDTGEPELNDQRSQRFTDSLMNGLRIRGIPDESIEGWFSGAKNPVASNETPAGRAKNNRVVLRVEIGHLAPLRPGPDEPATDANAKWRALIYRSVADGYAPKDVGFAFSPAVTLTIGTIADAARTDTETARAIADAFQSNEDAHWFGYMITLLAAGEQVSPLEIADIARKMPLIDMGSLITASLVYLGRNDGNPLGRELAAAQAAVSDMAPSPTQQYLSILTAGAGAYSSTGDLAGISERIRNPNVRDWVLTGAAVQALNRGEIDFAAAALEQLSESATRNLYFSLFAAAGFSLERQRMDEASTQNGRWLFQSPTLQLLERLGATDTLDLIHSALALASVIPVEGLPGGPLSLGDVRNPDLRKSIGDLLELWELVHREDWDSLRERLLAGSDADQIRLIGLASWLIGSAIEPSMLPGNRAELATALAGIGEVQPSPNGLYAILEALAGENGLTRFFSSLRNDRLRDYLIAAVSPSLAYSAFADFFEGRVEDHGWFDLEERLRLGRELVGLIDDEQIKDFVQVSMVPVDVMYRWGLEGPEDLDAALAVAHGGVDRIGDPIFRDLVWQALAMFLAQPDFPLEDLAQRLDLGALSLRMVQEIGSESTRDVVVAMLVPNLAVLAGQRRPTVITYEELDSRIEDPMIKAVALAELAIAVGGDAKLAGQWLDRAVDVAESADPAVRDEILSMLVVLQGDRGNHRRGLGIAAKIRNPATRSASLVIMGGELGREAAGRLLPTLALREQAHVRYLLELERIPRGELTAQSGVREDLVGKRGVPLLPWPTEAR